MTNAPMPQMEPSPFMTTDEVARFLNVTKRHIYRLVSEGRIPIVKWGRLLRFDRIEIAAWVDRARRSPGGGQPWA